jgi:hypothetical protein
MKLVNIAHLQKPSTVKFAKVVSARQRSRFTSPRSPRGRASIKYEQSASGKLLGESTCRAITYSSNRVGFPATHVALGISFVGGMGVWHPGPNTTEKEQPTANGALSAQLTAAFDWPTVTWRCVGWRWPVRSSGLKPSKAASLPAAEPGRRSAAQGVDRVCSRSKARLTCRASRSVVRPLGTGAHRLGDKLVDLVFDPFDVLGSGVARTWSAALAGAKPRAFKSAVKRSS